jgi:CBS domain-containing protein
MKTLREIMREGFLFTVPKTATVREAARVMNDSNVGIVAIVDGERIIGLFSERDAVRRVINKFRDPDTTTMQEVMTRELVIASETEDYQTAMRSMDQSNIRHLPVVRGTQVVSMLSIRDLMRVDMERMGDELRFLHEYLYTVPSEFLATK